MDSHDFDLCHGPAKPVFFSLFLVNNVDPDQMVLLNILDPDQLASYKAI